MTDFDSAALQTAARDDCTDSDHVEFDERDARALTQYLTVLDDVDEARGADDIYVVVSQSGSQYTVDLRYEARTCPDAEYRDVECKHIRRVKFATGARPIPAWVSPDAVDQQLGEHVDGPRMADGGAVTVATDGGTEFVVADDDGVLLEEGDDEGECEECAALPDDWVCADCYISGDAEAELPEVTDG